MGWGEPRDTTSALSHRPLLRMEFLRPPPVGEAAVVPSLGTEANVGSTPAPAGVDWIDLTGQGLLNSMTVTKPSVLLLPGPVLS